MASDRINLEDFLDPKIRKELDALNKELNQTMTNMGKLTKEAQKLNKNFSPKNINQVTKSRQQLNKVQKESTQTQKKAATTAQKYEQKLKSITKEEIRYKEQIREKRKAIKDEIRTEGMAEDSLEKKRVELIRLNKEYDESSGKIRRKMLPQIKKLRKEIGKAEEATGRHQRSVGQYGKALGALRMKFIAAAAGAVAMVRSIARGVGVFSGFEKQMDKVAAVSGATEGQIIALRNSAINLGSATTKSASQVANLQQEFAKLGFTADQILNATEATIRLAEVADADLGEAAKVAASTLNGFGLEATETQRVVDVMAKSFTSSALDLAKFTNSMNKVAPIAKNMGLSIEQTTAMIGKLTDAGIRAETAGAQLRNIFLDLSKKGMTLGEAYSQINNAADKNKKAMELFNKRAAASAVILAKTADETARFTEELENAEGAAEAMSRQMTDNLEGDVTRLSSAWEGFILSIENGTGIIARSLRSLIQYTTTLVRGVTKQTNAEEERISQLRIAQREFGKQISILRTANFNEEQRVKFIGQLNDKYGDYLPNLINEKDTLADIVDKQEQLNKQIGTRILAMEFEKDLQEIYDMQRQSAESLFEIEQERARLQQATGAVKNIQKQQEQLKMLEDVNKSIINSTGERVGDLEEKYKQMAKTVGATWESILNAITGTHEEEEAEEEETTRDIIETRKLRSKKIKGIVQNRANDEELIARNVTFWEKEQLTERERFYRDFQERVKDMDRKYLEFFAKMKGRTGEIAKQELEERKKNAEEWTNFGANQAKQLASKIFQFQRQELQNEQRMAVEKAKARGASEVEIAKIQKKYAKERQKQAVKEAIINGALAITQTLATTPFPANLIAAAIIAAKAAIEVITIKNQKFAKGTKDSGPDQMAWVGEKGTEAVKEKGGQTWFTPDKPTLMPLKAHSEVIPNKQLQNDLAMMGGGQPQGNDGQSERRHRELMQAIKGSKDTTYMNVTEKGFGITARKGNTWINYIDRKYRK